MNARLEPMIKPSVWPLDCPDTCSLSVEVADNRVVKVRGSRTNPYTSGVGCVKVAKYYPAFVHGEYRLHQPLRRTGERGSGQFEPISWNQALDLVYQGFSNAIEQFGPQSVLPLNYAGPHGLISGGSMDLRFFHRLGASLLDREPLCGGVRGRAYTSLFGNAPGMPPEQLRLADVVAVWGNNVTVSNLHLARVIKSARENGATLIVVDPKRTRIAEQAHLYLQIKPGTDVVLALALAAELERRNAFDQAFIDTWVQDFDRFMQQARQYSIADVLQICEIDAEQFDRLATHYATAKKLALSVGNGIERGHSGGSALRAIMSLNALTGQLGLLGAGIFAKPGLAFPLTEAKLQRPDLAPPGTRTLNIVDVGRHLLDQQLDPPIKAVFIYNHNPVCTHPDQNRIRRGLSREDLFVVGCDVVMTDSMAYADVILPACSHFEFDDIYASYGQSYLQRAEPVIPPVGDSLPNTEIFRRLAARFGFDEELFKEDDHALMDAAVDPSDPRLKGYRPSRLPTDRALLMNTRNEEPVLMCNTVKPATRSGKIELFSEELEQEYGYGIPRYDAVEGDLPLLLISPSSSKRTNATFGGDAASAPTEILELNPEDAAKRGIDDGRKIRLWNSLGEVELLARITDAVAPGVVYSPKGTWLKTSATGQTVNALISADLKTDIVQGACYNDTYVDCEPLE
ncbi:MAG: molybdopterin-dependent oxidoreductase [Proteobacteria bacterium]|nr:molybdopterin-dependent oxidoreductase [Pseudomonadota bacterium]